ncbi:WXG100 family type VII secretion target, partial [Nocardia elegans]
AEAAKNEMADAVDAIQRTLAAIDTAVDAARAGWKGEANTAFAQAVAEWDAETHRLNGVLREIEQQVGTGTVQLREMDAQGYEEFGGLRLA